MRCQDAEEQPVGTGADVLGDRSVGLAQDVEDELGLLDRVRELTGLDPMLSEDRERLGLGLKAYRIIAPRLPK